MPSYNTSLLLRKVVKCQQELVSLKAHQRYLTGQAKGYVSNTVRVTSRVLNSQAGYQRRAVLCALLFTGDKPDKVTIPTLRFQAYSSSGTPIYPTQGVSYGSLFIYAINQMAGDTPNTSEIAVEFMITDQGTADAFYIDFWTVSNDTGVLSFLQDLTEGR